ncbi:MAG: hypothetical protein ACM3NQ_03080 [Bacteroidales bacterium]
MDDTSHTRDLAPIDTTPEVGHETTDINARIVVGFGAALAFAALVIHVVVWLLFGVFGGLNTAGYPREFPLVQAGPLRLPPSPRLQDKPREDLKALRRHEDDLLNGYTWINQATGAVRVPVADAMKQVLDQGFPVEEQPATQAEVPDASSSGRTLEPAVKR